MEAGSNVVRLPTAAKSTVRQPTDEHALAAARALRDESPILHQPVERPASDLPERTPELALVMAIISEMADTVARARIAAKMAELTLRFPDCDSARQAFTVARALSQGEPL